MANGFKKAVRENLWVKVLLSGPSGAGKTYSALRLATGMVAKTGGSGVAYVDTENRRASYYANEFDFDVIDMCDPYTPEKYIDAIEMAVNAGYKVIVLDSLSLEWMYLNDVHDKMPGNSFANWGKLKPRHNALMEKILQSHIHIIATARGKDEYAMEEKNGKQTPKKLGVGIQGSKDIEYIFTCTFQITQGTNVAESTKDNTHLFEGRYDVLTENDGANLYNWANSGEVPKESNHSKIEDTATSTSDNLEDVINQIDVLARKAMSDNKIDRGTLSDMIKAFNDGSANFKAIRDVAVAKEIVAQLNEINQ